jgi:hypothetical protein
MSYEIYKYGGECFIYNAYSEWNCVQCQASAASESSAYKDVYYVYFEVILNYRGNVMRFKVWNTELAFVC